MKRMALLIGNSCEETIKQGVKNDLDNYASFLMSEKGGGYMDGEIFSLFNQSIGTIRNIINYIRTQQYDVVFAVFTGHGEYDNRKCERVMQIDANNEIYENELIDLAPKQILIIDTCAGLKYAHEKLPTMIVEASANRFSRDTSEYRKEYNRRCMQVPDQLLRLYSCSKGESSIDDNGGVYSTSLLQVLNGRGDINIVMAHIKATPTVAKLTHSKQNPSSSIPKLMDHQFLPGAITL